MSPPSAFGPYRVLHQIGSGVLGPVFRGYDSEHDRLVAIKTFKLDLVPEAAARLVARLQELAAAPPAHPAIVGIVGAGVSGFTPYAVYEFATGESLDVVLRQPDGLAPARARLILREVARAIDAAWAQGVGHGTLHPRDIFIVPGTTDVRITGFALAQALEAAGVRAPVRRPYTAPERAAGGAWDARADVYALGVIAREVLSGRGAGAPAGATDGALSRATAENPAERPQSATALIDAVADGPAGVPDAGVAETPATPAPARPAAQPAGAEPARAVRKPWVDRTLVYDRPIGGGPRLRVDAAPPAPPAPPPSAPAATRAAFTWPALGAVLAAGLIVGGLSGYQLGWTHGTAVGPAVVTLSQEPMADAAEGAPDPAAVPAPGQVTELPAPVPVAEPPASAPVATAARGVAAPAGRLIVHSVPAGALVTVDGRRAGETPVTVTGLSAGQYDLQVAYAGYVPRRETIELTADSLTRTVRWSLARGAGSVIPAAKSVGSIDVDSQPRGARVLIDGRPMGLTPVRVPELRTGAHRIQIDMTGHRTVTSTVNIVGGELTRLAVTLERSAAQPLAPKVFR